MDDPIKEQTASATPSETTVEEVKGTDVEVVVEPSAGSEQNGDASKATEVTQTETKQTQRNYEAELGKMSKLERERNEFEKKSRETEEKYNQARAKEQALEAIQETWKEDPTAYEAFRQSHLRKTGEDLGSHAQRYGSLQQPGYNNYSGYNGYVDPVAIANQAKEAAKAEIRTENMYHDALNVLIQAHPEVDPAKLNEDDRAGIQELVDKAGNLAFSLAQASGKPYADALVQAYDIITNRQSNDVAKAREDGELVGLAKAFSKATGDTGNVSGGSANKVTERYTFKTQAQADHFKELNSRNPRIAKLYAKNAAEE